MSVRIPFRRDLDFSYGQMVQVAPGVRRIVARNPSPFTLYGTGTYVLGRGNVAVIDPGPADVDHIGALVGALSSETITHMLVTHTHMDHSPGCRLLKEHTDAPAYAFGPHGAGKLERGVPVEEGGDMAFQPDCRVRHGELIHGDGWSVECVYTPGHTSNHMCYQLQGQETLFTGDHVMGWSTSIISPPDGDMAAYMASLELLLERNDRVYWPTHGPCIDEPKALVEAFIAHRRERERQIVDCIGDGVCRIEEMVPRMYADLPEFMHPAAARSVLAAVVHLVGRGVLSVDGEPDMDVVYGLA